MIINKKEVVVLTNAVAECKISLFGGNLLSYRLKSDKNDVFWMGDLNKFDNVHAIRGGNPICWPRFAEEKLNNNFPRHGFARLSMWNLDRVFVDEIKMEAELSLKPELKYNLNVDVKLYIKVTDKLECCLETINNGEDDFVFAEALHSYFYVGNRDMVKIKGLKGYKYKNSLDGKIYCLEDDLIIKNEFDGAFINHKGMIEIEDSVLKRVIKLEKMGSNSTVVWNPDKDLAEMSQGQYKNFICVEAANQGNQFVTLKPNERHKMLLFVNVKNF